MTPGARLAAALEILNKIANSNLPAADIIKAWGRAHRYAGSGDRRAISDRIYAVLRSYPAYAHLNGQWRLLVLLSLRDEGVSVEGIAALCDVPYGLGVLEAGEVEMLVAAVTPHPPGFAGPLPLPMGEGLFSRAPVDIRLNTLKQQKKPLDISDFVPCPHAAHGLRGPAGADVTSTQAYQSGLVEIQDEAAQIAAALVGAQPGEVVIDYCAGGGGKTLALAADMQNTGRLMACDVDRRRLNAIRPRAERAGVDVEYIQLPHATLPLADQVLVDAPCSGSGVWRRRPEDAWRLTQERLDELVAIQAQVLDQAAKLVKPGGRLVYVTCSVFEAENAAQSEHFLARHPEFRPLLISYALDTPALTSLGREKLAEWAAGGHTLSLTPAISQTDGFYIALFSKCW